LFEYQVLPSGQVSDGLPFIYVEFLKDRPYGTLLHAAYTLLPKGRPAGALPHAAYMLLPKGRPSGALLHAAYRCYQKVATIWHWLISFMGILNLNIKN